MTPNVVFFGSFQNYSQLILDRLLASPLVKVVAVVTTPPPPNNKKQDINKNPVQVMAEAQDLPVFIPEVMDDSALSSVMAVNSPIDYFVTAGYGKLLPPAWLTAPHLASLNLHFSLLPKYRGANPAEWALMLAETVTGVTLIEMSPEFDTGTMIAQATCDIASTDTRETLYQKLYELGGEVLPSMVATYHSFRTGKPLPVESSTSETPVITLTLPPLAQSESPTPYAKRLRREDGFIPWSMIQASMNGVASDPISTSGSLSESLQTMCRYLKQSITADFLERATRALAGFPGVWTVIPTAKGEKRMKILSGRIENDRFVLQLVQVEGQSPANWNQVKNVVQ
jgi:methionyl-tRNA formyltransferase